MITAKDQTLRADLRRGLYLVLTEPRDGYETVCRWAVEAGQ